MNLSKRELQLLKNADRQNRYWKYIRYIDLVWGTAALFFSYKLMFVSTRPLDWSAKLAIALLFGLGFSMLIRLRDNWRNNEVRLLLKLASESEVNAA